MSFKALGLFYYTIFDDKFVPNSIQTRYAYVKNNITNQITAVGTVVLDTDVNGNQIVEVNVTLLEGTIVQYTYNYSDHTNVIENPNIPKQHTPNRLLSIIPPDDVNALNINQSTFSLIYDKTTNSIIEGFACK